MSTPGGQVQYGEVYENQSCHNAMNCLVSSSFPNAGNAQVEE